MKLVSILALALFLTSCSSGQKSALPESTPFSTAYNGKSERAPSADDDLTGAYLGEGLYSKRRYNRDGLNRPAMRLYLERAHGEADTYYAVLVEYSHLLKMSLPFAASDKAPALNKVVGYLNDISSHISAYKLVPGAKAGTYEMHNLLVRDERIVPAADFEMTLNVNTKAAGSNRLAGAVITGNPEGQIVFPGGESKRGIFKTVAEALEFTQMELAQLIYKAGHLKSTWRGNWKDLEGSYLSQYGLVDDGVLELYTDSSTGQPKQKFIKTNRTAAKDFTNPKSASIEGDYNVLEPIPKMYILVPTKSERTASDKEMSGRIGLFLDVFDGSAPEAGSKLVTELAFTNPDDSEDFMMYYQHAEHKKNVGVLPAKKKKR